MLILLDPGHGLNTTGKRSPDGTLLEAAYNREIAQLTLSRLQTNVILISIHVNAAGDGTRWHTATGWSCYTC